MINYKRICKFYLRVAQGSSRTFPLSSIHKESAWSAGDLGLIPGSGRSSGEGNGYPLQYSCLENPRSSAWQAARAGHDLVTKPPPSS